MPFAHIYRSVMAPRTDKRKSPLVDRDPKKKAKTSAETLSDDRSTATGSADTTPTNIAAELPSEVDLPPVSGESTTEVNQPPVGGESTTEGDVPPIDDIDGDTQQPPAGEDVQPPSDVLSLPDGDRHFYDPFYMGMFESLIPYQNEVGQWLKGTEGPYDLTHLHTVEEDMRQLGVNYDSSRKMRITFAGQQGEHKVFPLWVKHDMYFHKFGNDVRHDRYVDMSFRTTDHNVEGLLTREFEALKNHLHHHVEALLGERRQMAYPIWSIPRGQVRHSMTLSLTLQGSDEQCPMVFNCEGENDTLVPRDVGLTVEATMRWYKDLLANKKLRVLMKISEVRPDTRNRNQVSISAYVGKIEILGDFRTHGNTGRSTPRAALVRRHR
jgi:hypothetical protein